ncbi:4650_t:CDS:1, partial [Racocetra fulgida]
PSPNQPPSNQPSQPVMSSPQPTTKLTTHSHYTCTNFIQLVLENESLKKEVKSLKVQLTSTQEELETYKSSRTSSLYSIFKYNFPHVSQTVNSEASSENRSESEPGPKKRKTLPFA